MRATVYIAAVVSLVVFVAGVIIIAIFTAATALAEPRYKDDADKIARMWMASPSTVKNHPYEEWLFVACEALEWDLTRAPSCTEQYQNPMFHMDTETSKITRIR